MWNELKILPLNRINDLLESGDFICPMAEATADVWSESEIKELVCNIRLGLPAPVFGALSDETGKVTFRTRRIKQLIDAIYAEIEKPDVSELHKRRIRTQTTLQFVVVSTDEFYNPGREQAEFDRAIKFYL